MQAVTPENGRPSFKPSLHSGAFDSVWHWGRGQTWLYFLTFRDRDVQNSLLAEFNQSMPVDLSCLSFFLLRNRMFLCDSQSLNGLLYGTTRSVWGGWKTCTALMGICLYKNKPGCCRPVEPTSCTKEPPQLPDAGIYPWVFPPDKQKHGSQVRTKHRATQLWNSLLKTTPA